MQRGGLSSDEDAQDQSETVAWAAPPAPGATVPKRHATAAEFYSYPDWLISQVCCVHIQTARHWKSGIRAPGAGALRLWQLYRDGRILDDAWQGWGVYKGKLCDPEGHELTQGQLRAYAFVWELAREYGKTNSRAQDILVRLSSVGATSRSPKHQQQLWMSMQQLAHSTEAEKTAFFGPHPNPELRPRKPRSHRSQQSGDGAPRRRVAS